MQKLPFALLDAEQFLTTELVWAGVMAQVSPTGQQMLALHRAWVHGQAEALPSSFPLQNS